MQRTKVSNRISTTITSQFVTKIAIGEKFKKKKIGQKNKEMVEKSTVQIQPKTGRSLDNIQKVVFW